MSTKELASMILDSLTEEQLKAFVTLFMNAVPSSIKEEEPDSWDTEMIANSYVDNDEAMPLDDFVKELGFKPDDLRI